MVGSGKKAGTHVGRVAVRSSGSFNIQAGSGLVQGISYRHCTLVQRSDGYGYFIQPIAQERNAGTGLAKQATLSLPGMNAGVSRAER